MRRQGRQALVELALGTVRARTGLRTGPFPNGVAWHQRPADNSHMDLDAVYLGVFLCWLSAVALLGVALALVCAVERWRAASMWPHSGGSTSKT